MMATRLIITEVQTDTDLSLDLLEQQNSTKNAAHNPTSYAAISIDRRAVLDPLPSSSYSNPSSSSPQSISHRNVFIVSEQTSEPDRLRIPDSKLASIYRVEKCPRWDGERIHRKSRGG